MGKCLLMYCCDTTFPPAEDRMLRAGRVLVAPEVILLCAAMTVDLAPGLSDLDQFGLYLQLSDWPLLLFLLF